MNEKLIHDFKQKIAELRSMAQELDEDYLEVKSSEQSLLVESVVKNLEEDEQKIARVIFLEEQRAKQN